MIFGKVHRKVLLNFLQFCDIFAQKNNFRSEIKFTSTVSKATVEFLDPRVKFPRSLLMTELSCKPASSHIYQHDRTDHPYHTIESNWKYQFLLIRRICTGAKDYWKHANNFIHHYGKRRYKESGLKQICE